MEKIDKLFCDFSKSTSYLRVTRDLVISRRSCAGKKFRKSVMHKQNSCTDCLLLWFPSPSPSPLFFRKVPNKMAKARLVHLSLDENFGAKFLFFCVQCFRPRDF